MPAQDFLYWGDNAHAPYGTRPPEDVSALTQAAVAQLFARGCRLVLIACNTASAIALRPLQRDWLPGMEPERRLLGVFVPLIEAVAGHGWREPGQSARRLDLIFFATPATVASGAFTREAHRLAPGLRIVEQACPGLVTALEAGEDAAPAVKAATRDALARYDAGAVPDMALLGCTHYPLAEAVFRATLPPQTAILSQPEIVAASLARYLDRHRGLSGGAGRITYLTTGDPVQVSARASALFGRVVAFSGV